MDLQGNSNRLWAAGSPRRVSGRGPDLRTNGPIRVRNGHVSGPAMRRAAIEPLVAGAMLTEVTDRRHAATERPDPPGSGPVVLARPGIMGSHFA